MSDFNDLDDIVGDALLLPPRAGRKYRMKPRGWQIAKCTRGHSMTSENIYLNSGTRHCLKCKKLRLVCAADLPEP